MPIRLAVHAFVAAIVVVIVIASPGAASAQQRPPAKAPAAVRIDPSQPPAADASGAKDAAALPRYAGSILLENKSSAFDEIRFPNAKLARVAGQRDGRNNALNLPPEPLKVEGRLSRLMYLLPEGRSALEVIRGYQQAVQERGGKTIYECGGADCGGSPVNRVTQGGNETGIVHMLYPYDLVTATSANCPLTEDRANQRYALLDLPNGGGKAAVLSWTVGDMSAGSSCKAWVGRLVAMVVVVETAAREQRMETVKASAVGEGLGRDGRVALYAIQFDTAKADIKPESQSQIAELVTYLQGNPSVRALIVGHTDNQGALDYNIDLSKRRAQAVVGVLSSSGIAPARLVAQGVGMAAPLATNESDEGRAKNRRVELVKQ
jgi:outer membrane protein OmpA-like peptidoglycan-associated protein